MEYGPQRLSFFRVKYTSFFVIQFLKISGSNPYFVGFQTIQIKDLQAMLYHTAKVLSLSSTLFLDSSRLHCGIVFIFKVHWLGIQKFYLCTKSIKCFIKVEHAPSFPDIGCSSLGHWGYSSPLFGGFVAFPKDNQFFSS